MVACKSEVRLKEFKQDLCRKFDVKDLGKLHHFLGLKVAQDELSGDVWVSQLAYVGKVLERLWRKLRVLLLRWTQALNW